MFSLRIQDFISFVCYIKYFRFNIFYTFHSIIHRFFHPFTDKFWW